MEMNTRLQVEHPVTEFITGLDLVEWQLRVAAGEKLPLAQDQLAINGHAFEVRLYAEDPDRDFLPQTGTITHLAFPPENGHVRIDTGITQGKAISTYYDPMIAKLIVWDRDRPSALAQLRRALAQTEIGGLVTNTSFLVKLASNKAFAKGDVDTGFIGRHEKELLPSVPPASEEVLVLAATGLMLGERRADASDPWASMDGWRHYGGGHDHLTLIDVSGGQASHKLAFDYVKDGFLFHLKKSAMPVSATLSPTGKLTADLGGRRVCAGFAARADDVTLFLDGIGYRLKRAGLDLGEADGEAAALKIVGTHARPDHRRPCRGGQDGREGRASHRPRGDENGAHAEGRSCRKDRICRLQAGRSDPRRSGALTFRKPCLISRHGTRCSDPGGRSCGRRGSRGDGSRCKRHGTAGRRASPRSSTVVCGS